MLMLYNELWNQKTFNLTQENHINKLQLKLHLLRLNRILIYGNLITINFLGQAMLFMIMTNLFKLDTNIQLDLNQKFSLRLSIN